MFGALYVLHQDFWFWRSANPLVFGFIPVGLFYHACYTIVVALVLWMLVRQAWPSELEERLGDEETGRGGDRRVAQSPSLPIASSGEGRAR